MSRASDIAPVAAALQRWAVPMPDMGCGVYRLTHGPSEHKHSYQSFCPWSPDGRWLLLLQYDRIHLEARVCVLDLLDGSLRTVGVTTQWNSHTAAYQQWQGRTGRLVYYASDENTPALVSVMPDGTDCRVIPTELEGCNCTADGQWAIGATPRTVLFPDDQLAPRHDKGLIRLNLLTGRSELILSVEQALAVVPHADSIRHCHLYVKMTIPHQRLSRVLFNLTNTLWDRGCGEPQVRLLMAVNCDGGSPAYLGPIAHHPNWHPLENTAVVNVKDDRDNLRFGCYDGQGIKPLRCVPHAKGAGHPSFTRDGRWICTDRMSECDRCQLTLNDVITGEQVVLAEYDGVSEGYATFKSVTQRQPGQTVIGALRSSNAASRRTWQTHAHPTWSRDGNVILFNADLGHGSQLYAVDWHEAMERGAPSSSIVQGCDSAKDQPALSQDMSGSSAPVKVPVADVLWKPEGTVEFCFRASAHVGPRAIRSRPVVLARSPLFTLTLIQTPQLVQLSVTMAHDGSLPEEDAAALTSGNIFWAFLRHDRWYRCTLAWNAPRGDLDLYLNGCSQEEIRLLRRRPTWPAPSFPQGHLELGGTLNAGEADEVRLAIGEVHLWTRCLSAQEIRHRLHASPDFDLVGEGRWDYPGSLAVDPGRLSLLYEADFTGPLSVVHEDALFQNDQRVKEPAGYEWVLEGPGVAQARDGICTVASTEASRLSHLVLWNTRCFPDNILIEFEMNVEDTTRGLTILFFATRNLQGGSPFAPGMEKRGGIFTRYHSGQLNGYHVSYWACNVQAEIGIPRRTANLRKNRGFRMVSVGVDRIGAAEPSFHRVRLLKQGPRVILETRGQLALIYTDSDPPSQSPTWTDGWIGLRQMGSSEKVAYRQLRVWKLSDDPAAAS